MARNYEVLTILPGTLAETDVQPVVDKMKEMIESEGTKNLTVDSLGKSRLAYPIKHIRYGYFHIFTFESETENIKKIEEKLRLFGQILRTMIRVYDPKKRTETRQTISSFASTEDERIKEEPREVAAPTPVAVEEPKEEVKEAPKKASKKKEDKPVEMQDFDKQLEAILDDKIAGL